MLVQLHHQNIKNSNETIFVAQFEWSRDEFDKRIEELRQSHPCPEGYQWMICNETSKYFMMQKEK